MTADWLTIAEIAAAWPDLSARALNRKALAWRQPGMGRKRDGRGGGWEYHVSVLPPAVRARLALASEAGRPETERAPRSAELWARFEALSERRKRTCEDRLNVILEAETLARAGLGETAAARRAARAAGVSPATVFNWKARLAGVDRGDWLAALAPGHKGASTRAECHPDAWAALKSDYLRPEGPGFSACYRRALEAAAKQGWSPIPSERALRRRLDAEVPAEVQKLARKGRDVAKALYPAQRRTRRNLHAMAAVNMDGHKFDVRVILPDGSEGRPCLVAIQDIYSGKFLSWRLDQSENRVPVRLAIGDMVERFGIPDKMVFDNGRSFASKWISGGAPNRYRFKVRDDEPQGLITQLGIEILWTLPYSGQSKPIERAFGDFCENIARHPFCAGAYTGNSPVNKPANYGSRAIPFEDFRAFVDVRIAEHNRRGDRKTETARGISFDEAFERSLAAPSTVVRWPTSAQKALWLLAAEGVTARKGNGEIHLMGNRYWAPALTGFAGRKVAVRFDPDDLALPVKVYGLDGALVCEAEAVGDVDFFDAAEAHRHARNRNAYLKALNEQKRLHAEMSAEELARLYSGGEPAPMEPRRPAVPRIAVGSAARKIAPEAEPAADWDEESEANFSRALRLVAGRDLEED